jgi:alginate O-acetyltransferase complex protein AlgI
LIFTEGRFFLFLLVAWSVHWALRAHAARKAWLLVCSYAFYAAWDWRFLSLIVLSTAVDYACGLRLAERRARGWLVLSLAVNLGLLALFKYFDFFAESAAELLRALGFRPTATTLDLVLPVGISFYTFQTLSYTIDVYRGRIAATRSPLDFALFVAFFPQLVAGPIVRAADFLPQLQAPRRLAELALRPHVMLFLIGFFKKAVVADNLAAVVDPVFADPAAWTAGSAWLALALYVAQIYCDFSGYTDMAIGCAGLFGYRLAVNFAHPYLATSVTAFWRRWHISLSSWFRDYLYVPLGGNRRGRVRTGVNLAVVFLLCGLWHGASWTFVAWGAFHGVLLALERPLVVAREGRGWPGGQVYVVAAWAASMVLFRSASLADAGLFAEALAGRTTAAGAVASVDPLWWGALAALWALHLLSARGVIERAARALPPLVHTAAAGALTGGMLSFVAVHHQPFIYFQF